jgi:hypothetical protein
MAVNYITEKANVNTLSYVFGKISVPSFQKKVIMLNHMYLENVPAETNVLRLEKDGYLVAEAHTEATANALSANGELTDTYVDLTAAGICVVSGLSAEAQRFGGAKASPSRMLKEQGKALAHYLDDDALSLASSMATTVTSTAGLTFDDLYLGQYTIYAAECPDQDVQLSFIGAARGFQHLGLKATQAGAAAYANDVLLGIFKDTGGKPAANGFRGEVIPGVDGYMTSGFSTGSSDNYQMLIHPKWALACIMDQIPIVKTAEKVEEGFYTSIGSLLFYDVGTYCTSAGVCVKSDTAA